MVQEKQTLFVVDSACWVHTTLDFTTICLQLNFVPLPLGLNDPDSKSGFSSLLIHFFNSAKKSTISSGDRKRISSVVESSSTSRYEVFSNASGVCVLTNSSVTDLCLDVC